jgi:RecA-family ATPase
MLSGEGGVGKSCVALHLSVAHVVGGDWLGAMPELGSAMVLCCEDDDSELHYRYAQIVDHYHVAFADFTISFSTVMKLNKKRYAAHRDSPFGLHH